MRVQAESHEGITAPDGQKATVVENTPSKVTFYVSSGNYAGYYEYNKGSKQKEIRHLP